MNNGLGVSELDIGISGNGMYEYAQTIASNMEKVKDAVDEYQSFEQAINNAWQGVSRDRFMEQFYKVTESLKEQLDLEYADLMARLTELQENYYKQDEALLDEM